MRQETLTIRMSNTEGALERILGRLRARNFEVCSITADRTTDRNTLEARITIESTRPFDLAIKQITKLYDVESVHVFNPGVEGSHGYRELQSAK